MNLLLYLAHQGGTGNQGQRDVFYHLAHNNINEGVSCYFGTPLLFVFAWLIMGIITKEPFVCRQPESGGKTCFAAQKQFFTPNALHISQKSSTFAPAVDNWVVHIY